jgi:hypothetical protein
MIADEREQASAEAFDRAEALRRGVSDLKSGRTPGETEIREGQV